jgi:hypothetical protein
MGNKPPSSIYSIVEKAYFRLQAGDVITHCLEDGSTDPLHQMIQEMVLAGPQNLDALREILAEAVKRKAQVYDDLNQVNNQLSIILKGYGINLDNQKGIQVLQTLSEHQLRDILDEQGIVDDEARTSSLQVLMDSQELISTLTQKIQLLENIETYLQDWLWGLTYQFIRHADDEGSQDINKGELQ